MKHVFILAISAVAMTYELPTTSKLELNPDGTRRQLAEPIYRFARRLRCGGQPFLGSTGRNIMNRRTALALTTTVLAGVALSAGDAMAQQRSLKEQLVGTWTLVSIEETGPNGTKQQYFGANPRGILMLDAGGRYAQVWGRADRPKFKASNPRLDTPAAEYGEAARAFGGAGVWRQFWHLDSQRGGQDLHPAI
jgi:hypothetical protein